jgi:serine/threonine-protein kinase
MSPPGYEQGAPPHRPPTNATTTTFIRGRTEAGASLPTATAQLSDVGPPAELLNAAAQRVRLLSAALTASLAVMLVFFNTMEALGVWHHPQPGPRNLLLGLATVLSAALYAASRVKRLGPAPLLDLALGYEVVGAFMIGLTESLSPERFELDNRGFSAVCIWVAIFPLLAPSSPGKMLVASVATALMSPLGYLINTLHDHRMPVVGTLLWQTLSAMVCAVLSHIPARVLLQLGAQVSRLRALGSYELVERLGGGGMGEVWRARHRMLVRPAAIKLIRAETLRSGDIALKTLLERRFFQEAQATAALRSPHTVELYDFGVTEDGTLYYVMELLHGLDLDELVRRFGPLPAPRATQLLMQSCLSLMDAHAHGMLHRDIKPANLFVANLGPQFDFVKVLDFGLVKLAEPMGAAPSPKTQDGFVTGTPDTMAPEAALGRAPIDERVDIYSLGCVGYWLLTGRMVFDSGTSTEVLLNHIQTAPVPPSQRTRLPIPPALEKIVLSCLAKSPLDRPPSARALYQALAACDVGEPWNEERAEAWWSTNLPDIVRAASDSIDQRTTRVYPKLSG